MRFAVAALLLVFALAAHASESGLSKVTTVPADMRAVAKKASDDFKAQRLDAAAAGYQTIVDRYPACVEAWTNLGIVRVEQDDLDAAIRAFKNAARLDSHDATVQTRLGMCFFESRKYSAAIPPLERAAALNPDNSNIHACLARCYEKVGRDDDAARERSIEGQMHPEMVE